MDDGWERRSLIARPCITMVTLSLQCDHVDMLEVKCIVISPALPGLKCFCSTKCKTLLWWSIVVSSPSVYIEYLVYQIPQSDPALSLQWRRLCWPDSEAMTPTLIVNVAPTVPLWSSEQGGHQSHITPPTSLLYSLSTSDWPGLMTKKCVTCSLLTTPTSSWAN